MAPGTERPAAWRGRISSIFPETLKKKLFSAKPHSGPRTIVIGRSGNADDSDGPRYPDNAIRSSKYNILTFLPKNLFEQFQRVANFYFLTIGLVQFLIDTPVSPVTSVAPLVFVISVTAIKQGYEDWLRHKADNEVNQRQTALVRDGTLDTKCRSKDIKVGDIVQVRAEEEFPCDLVLLSSSDEAGTCYITTANLDGETNLKTLYSIPDTRGLRSPQELWHNHMVISCNPPLSDLYSFEGVMQVAGTEERSLGLENILLRGARLKNTEYIYGCAVYTGKDTKMALNSKSKKAKFSRVEKKMNSFLVMFMGLLFLQSMLSTALCYSWEDRNGDPWYVPDSDDKSGVRGFFERFLSFVVLYNYIIPISLYVTVEMQKFIGSLFLRWDIEMYDATMNESALANTSDLNEELGQVEYLFTDKTGTLTENLMAFRRCCIGHRKFQEVDGVLCECDDNQLGPVAVAELTPDMNEFFQVLTVCHTVHIDRQKNKTPCHSDGVNSKHSMTDVKFEYQASSPDEKAFVEACSRYGIVYHGTCNGLIEVSFRGKMKTFRLLHTLPFDPTRKRMSVIIEDEKGNIHLYCKGAEIAILDRVVSGDLNTTQDMIDEYSKLGLRTLTIAHRALSPDEFAKIDKMLKEAQTSLQNRETKLSEVYNEVETSLVLLGATAVEDKLQEDVPQTIRALRQAGIKVWVLTGDKEETAVNISHSASHFNSCMVELRLTQISSDEGCEEQLLHLLNMTSLSETNTKFALIVDGKSLIIVLKLYRRWFRELCEKCVAVLCCRMSPLQKAQVVALIKESPDKPVTAAIGDGANDVSMIQEADVGLAIMGKEGRQAVRNSDYAFAKFRFLQRILLFHGHLYYNRIAILVQYYFYKNVAWITGQFFYSFFSAYSQQTLYDPFFLTLYNIVFTFLPILLFGLFEQHRSQEILMTQPAVYKSVTKNSLLSWKELAGWNILAIWHASVFFFGVKFVIGEGESIFYTGKDLDVFSFGTLVLFITVIAVNMKLMLETYFWCAPMIIGYLLTFAGLIVLSVIFNQVFWPSWMTETKSMFRVLYNVFASLTSWMTLFLLVVLALLPDVTNRVIRDYKWMHEYRQAIEKSKSNELTRIAPVQPHSYTAGNSPTVPPATGEQKAPEDIPQTERAKRPKPRMMKESKSEDKIRLVENEKENKMQSFAGDDDMQGLENDGYE